MSLYMSLIYINSSFKLDMKMRGTEFTTKNDSIQIQVSSVQSFDILDRRGTRGTIQHRSSSVVVFFQR